MKVTRDLATICRTKGDGVIQWCLSGLLYVLSSCNSLKELFGALQKGVRILLCFYSGISDEDAKGSHFIESRRALCQVHWALGAFR